MERIQVQAQAGKAYENPQGGLSTPQCDSWTGTSTKGTSIVRRHFSEKCGFLQIRATFEGYGELEDVVLVPKEQVAFVVFKHLQDAKLCANCLDGQW